MTFTSFEARDQRKSHVLARATLEKNVVARELKMSTGESFAKQMFLNTKIRTGCLVYILGVQMSFESFFS